LPYLVYGTLYVLVYLSTAFFLGRWPLVRTVVSDAVLAGLAGAACLVILRRRRGWAGVQRVFWDAFAVSQALWIVGELGFMYGEIVDGRPSWVRWHTMFSLCGGIGPMIAVLARPDRGVRKPSTNAIVVDLLSYGLLAGFVYAYFVMVPSLAPVSGQQLEATLLRLVQVHRLLLVVGFGGAAWLAGASPWRKTYLTLFAGTAAGFVLRMVTNAAISRGAYYSGSVYDLAWIVPFIGYVWAAAEAPASSAEREDVLDGSVGAPSPIFSAIPVLLIPLLGYTLVQISPLGEAADAFRVLLTTMATVAGLGFLTLRFSVQSGELQRADERLRLLAAVVEQTGDIILITRPDARIEHANIAAVRASGYPRERLAMMNLTDLLVPAEHPRVNQIGAHVRTRGVWRGTLQHLRADGSTFPAASTVVALRDADGHVTHFVGVQRDVTDEVRMRDQLVHSERLSAVGELVAGVAHEINNPLQSIVGCVELLMEQGGDAERLRDLKLVRQEAARAGQIVRNLLAFVRRGSPDRSPADLNEIVRATAELRKFHLVQRGIDLQLELAPGRVPVLANRDELQQVLVNLILNAEHALDAAATPDGRIVLRTSVEDGMSVLRVSDNGPGISPDLQGRVFEPFFTTKDVGEGTGLGLSISLGIAHAHGGTLELCAGTGQGACFKLSIPATDDEQAAVKPAAVPAIARRRGAAAPRALVVEDEAPVRRLIVRFLRRRGYEVREVESCAGVRQAAASGACFDLILSDVRLNDGNGAACVGGVLAERPAFAERVIFVTGDAGAIAKAAPELAAFPVLPKPFTSADLDRMLATAQPVEP
jgi:two-component system NtrC family sensor kinase